MTTVSRNGSQNKIKALIRKEVKKAVQSVLKEQEAPVDQTGADELYLYISNDGDLYRRQMMPIMKNLARKIKRDMYDSRKAVKLWMYLVDDGAKKYVKEFDSPDARWHETFPKPTRTVVAKRLAEEFENDIKVGEYDIDELAKK